MMTYQQHRKDRLADVIGEYLHDEDSSALTFYNDVMDELKIWQDYHRKYYDKINAMQVLINQTFNPTNNRL